MQTNVSVEMSTIVVVKNRCQFCYAFFKDPEKIAEHCNRCEFRFAETFKAFDGKVKFACAVCFDVFQTRAGLIRHEQLHKFPGSFSCSVCNESFLNDPECVQHMEIDHEEFKADYNDGYSASMCHDCGAYFEQQSYLRLHNETNCGRHRCWNCIHCGPNLLTADAYNLHIETEHKPVLELQEDLMMPAAEVSLNKILDIAAIEDTTKKDTNAGDSSEDPLLLILKDEKGYDSEIEQKLTDEVMEDISRSLARETVIERLNAPSVNFEPAGSASIDIPNLQHIPKIGIGEKYKCKYCDKQHLSKAAHDQHTLKHGPDGKLVYKCDVCYVYFASRQDRNEHATTVHKERLTCKICSMPFGSLGSIQSHMRFMHKIRECEVEKNPLAALKQFDSATASTIAQIPIKRSAQNESSNESNSEEERKTKPVKESKFKCQYCRSKYRTEKGLRRHIEDHGPDGSLMHRCDTCPIYFKTSEERDEHSLTAHKEKNLCTICNQTFRNQQRLQRHERDHHPGGKAKEKRIKKYISQKYCCVKCGIAFTNRTILDNHEKSDCGREPQYKCDDCGKRFSTKGSLTVHMKIHSNEKNFPCSYCGKCFRYSKGVRLHIQYQHTNERPHKCDLCDKSFVDISSLKVHMTIHTGIKRYVCYGCGLRYPTNSALHKHRNARKDSCALLPIQPPLKIAES